MTKKRKRASGAGMKPRGEFAGLGSTLTVRMPANMRAQLELEAAARDRSISQELMRRLQESFHRDAEKTRDPALYALIFLIVAIAERLEGGILIATGKARSEILSEWRTDPFKFKAFKIAVGKLLDGLDEPRGKLQSPITQELCVQITERIALGTGAAKKVWNKLRLPDGFAAFILGQLRSASEEAGAAWELMKEEKDFLRYPGAAQALQREHNLPRAFNDLELKPKAAQSKDKAND
jgi:hypothetical protein